MRLRDLLSVDSVFPWPSGVWNFIPFSHGVTGTQALGPFSALFPGTIAGRRIGRMTAGTQTSALIWDVTIVI